MSYYHQPVQSFQHPQYNYGYSAPNQTLARLVKKHECDFCPYRSDRKYNVVVHQRKMHPARNEQYGGRALISDQDDMESESGDDDDGDSDVDTKPKKGRKGKKKSRKEEEEEEEEEEQEQENVYSKCMVIFDQIKDYLDNIEELRDELEDLCKEIKDDDQEDRDEIFVCLDQYVKLKFQLMEVFQEYPDTNEEDADNDDEEDEESVE